MSESESAADPSSRGVRDDQPSLSPAALNPAALPVAAAARVLSRLSGSGRPITEAMLRADIDAGAPTNPDGSLNVIHYAAWLVQQLAAGSRTAAGPASTLEADTDGAPGDDVRGAAPSTMPPERERGGED